MKEKAFQESAREVLDAGMTPSHIITEKMTAAGAVNKSFILVGIMMLTTVFSYGNPSPLLMWGGAIGGLIVVLVTSFKRHLSPTLAPVYAALEGLFVGAVSAIYATSFGGAIVFHAVTLTFSVLFMMLFIYKTGIIKVTERLRMGLYMALGAIVLVYLMSFILGLFGMSVPFLHSGGTISIVISVVIVGVASMFLLLDFDNFEKGEKYGAPAYMEWFCAMGLLITLVWLYVEMLRLLALLSGRD